MVTVIKKINAESGLTWLNFSGATLDVVQRLADEDFTKKNVVNITYSADGTTAFALACRRP